jgi:hypothetical protein
VICEELLSPPPMTKSLKSSIHQVQTSSFYNTSTTTTTTTTNSSSHSKSLTIRSGKRSTAISSDIYNSEVVDEDDDEDEEAAAAANAITYMDTHQQYKRTSRRGRTRVVAAVRSAVGIVRSHRFERGAIETSSTFVGSIVEVRRRRE